VFVERAIPVQLLETGRGAGCTAARHLHPAQGQPGGRHRSSASSCCASQLICRLDEWAKSVQQWVNDYLVNPTSIVYIAVFGLLIIAFAYFYTAITFDPAKQADTIRKQGGFIPGIRPGPQTERYLAKILSRITLPGALFLAAIALIPSIAMTKMLEGQNQVSFSGISILIAVGVALETMKQIDSQLMMRNYEGFLK
jgi:preprotein translocase subunit SecY